MIIPENETLKAEYLTWILSTCLASKEEAESFVPIGAGNSSCTARQRRQRHHLQSRSRAISIWSARSSTRLTMPSFHCPHPPMRPMPRVKRFMAAQDAFNNDFRDAGAVRFLRQCAGLVAGDGHHHRQNGAGCRT